MHRAPRSPASRSMLVAAALVAFAVVGCSSPEPTPSALATDACQLADEVLAGEVGMARTAYRGQQILRRARDAEVTVDDLLTEAQTVCPETIEALPIGADGDSGEVPSFGELAGLFDQLEDLDLEGLDLGDTNPDSTRELDLSNLDLSDLDASTLESFDLDELNLSEEDLAHLRALLDDQRQ
ncbi:MAG: hypothetical protein WDZ26_06140 [Nitriliruptoraceae bacterium]